MLPSVFGENLFDDFFDDAFEKNFFGGRNPLYGKNAKNLMKTDVKETDSAYVVDIDLPGSCSRSFYVGDVTVEDIKCKYDAGVLQVTVPKKEKAAIAARNRIEIE